MKKRGVFIVTGASRGLGKAIAEEAYASGYSVALLARSERDLQAAKADLERRLKRDGKISVHAVDLASARDVVQVMKSIKATHGEIKALVNNAATWMGSQSVSTVSAKKIQESFDSNFFTAFNATQSMLSVAKPHPRRPVSVINIGATASLDAWPDVLPFCLAKSALRSYSRALARELGNKGVHVAHLVIDGMLDNERTRKLNRSLPADRFINMKSVAQSVLHVALQEKSCWTMEWDVRPYNENF